MKNKQFVPEMRFAGFSSDWERVPITEVFTLRNGYTPSKAISEYWTGGTIPWFRMEDIREHGRVLADAIQHVTPQAVKGGGLFPAGSLIVTTTATIGEHALLIADSLANQRFTVFQTVNRWGSIEKEYWLYRFYQLGDWCRANTNAGGLAAVNMDALQKYLIDLPEKDERIKIVNFLSNIDNLVNKSDQEVTRLEKLKAAMLQKMFPRQGETTPEVRFKGFSGDWEAITLSKIGEVKMCKRVLKSQTSEFGEIPFFKIGTFGKFPDAYISQSLYEQFKRLYPFPKNGDVIISAAGTIGRAIVYDGQPAYFQDSNLIWIDNNNTVVDNCYLAIIIPKINWFSSSTTISRIYNDTVRNTSIIIPPSIEEQRIISRYFRGLDSLILAKKKKLIKLQHIKASCLSKMFVNAPQ